MSAFLCSTLHTATVALVIAQRHPRHSTDSILTIARQLRDLNNAARRTHHA